MWAVYDLREMWQSIGARLEQVRKTAEPGRNDVCYCVSGRKYKKVPLAELSSQLSELNQITLVNSLAK